VLQTIYPKQAKAEMHEIDWLVQHANRQTKPGRISISHQKYNLLVDSEVIQQRRMKHRVYLASKKIKYIDSFLELNSYG
jgi:hypothetical protein